MIQHLNNLLNNIFKILRFMSYVLITIIWGLIFPILYTLYLSDKSKDKIWSEHPYYTLFIWYVRLGETWSKIIF